MRVTEVNMRLAEPALPEHRDGVLAYVNIVLDSELAIKGIRLVRVRGKVLASMPNKERTRDCPKCRGKNNITHRHCTNCGQPLPRYTGSGRVFSDTVHPVTSGLREHIEQVLSSAYEERKRHAANHTDSGS